MVGQFVTFIRSFSNLFIPEDDNPILLRYNRQPNNILVSGTHLASRVSGKHNITPRMSKTLT